jgi:hypothetical protein|nr:MAG TPA: hypothetical protein [Crassvirales sp.]
MSATLKLIQKLRDLLCLVEITYGGQAPNIFFKTNNIKLKQLCGKI